MLAIEKKLPAIVAGLFISGYQIFFPTQAAQAGSFSVSPMVTISDAKGSQAKGSINVTNSGREPLRMRVYTEDFTYERTKGYVPTAKHDRSAVPYLQFSPRELVIPPGVTRNVRVGVVLPPSVPDGEYRASIFVEELREQDIKSDAAKKSQVVMLARVASVFFVAKGGVKADLQVSSAVWNSQQKGLSILLSNKGKKSAYPNINWKISQNGKEVSSGNILGVVSQTGIDREVTLRTKDNKSVALPPGSYQLTGEIINTGQKPVPFSVGVSIP